MAQYKRLEPSARCRRSRLAVAAGGKPPEFVEPDIGKVLPGQDSGGPVVSIRPQSFGGASTLQESDDAAADWLEWRRTFGRVKRYPKPPLLPPRHSDIFRAWFMVMGLMDRAGILSIHWWPRRAGRPTALEAPAKNVLAYTLAFLRSKGYTTEVLALACNRSERTTRELISRYSHFFEEPATRVWAARRYAYSNRTLVGAPIRVVLPAPNHYYPNRPHPKERAWWKTYQPAPGWGGPGHLRREEREHMTTHELRTRSSGLPTGGTTFA